VGLRFPPKTETQCKVRLQTPIVLYERTEVHLIKPEVRMARVHGVPRWSVPQSISDISTRVTRVQELYGGQILLDRCHPSGLAWNRLQVAAEKRKCAAQKLVDAVEILWTRIVQQRGSDSSPEFRGVRAPGYRRIVLKLEIVLEIVGAREPWRAIAGAARNE